jgi:RimJ/RimL family protein N-acetyltransferase
VAHPGEEAIAFLYLSFLAEGTIDIIWHDRRPSLREVLEWHRNPTNVFFACYAHSIDSGVKSIIGLVWANSIKTVGDRKIGEVGMAFLKPWQRDGIPQECADMGLEHLFQNESLDAVFGTTPAPNRAAVRFAIKLGFDKIGIAPFFVRYDGVAVDAVLSVLTKDKFYKPASGEEVIENQEGKS